MKLAAIDIGSNAIRLLVKDTESDAFLSDLDSLHAGDYYERVPLKSGIDVFAHGAIQPKTEITLTAAICRFASIMQHYQVTAYRACATSAYRDAANGQEVIDRVNKASGLNVEIIPGDEEARITRLSYCPPAEWEDDTFLFADVGGGSTEIALMRQGKVLYSHSFQIGSMRYVCGNQSPEQEQALDQKIAEIYHDHPTLHYLGVGGCVKFMNKYLNGGRGNTVLVSEMRTVYKDLQSLSVDQIVENYGLPHERADILTPASSIFLHIAEGLHSDTIMVPSIGVRNGIITELYHLHCKQQ